MGTTELIRDNAKLEQFKDYYQTQNPNPRNYTLIILGLHTALRIGDILRLQWKDVYDFEQKHQAGNTLAAIPCARHSATMHGNRAFRPQC